MTQTVTVSRELLEHVLRLTQCNGSKQSKRVEAQIRAALEESNDKQPQQIRFCEDCKHNDDDNDFCTTCKSHKRWEPK